MNKSFYLLIITMAMLSATELAFSKPNCRNVNFSPAEISSHIKYLASDDLKGRMSGTPGAEKAAHYISSEFKKSGLKPLGENGTYFQEFSFTQGVELGSENSLEFISDNTQNKLELGKEYNTLNFSSSGHIDAELVFAGYGISAPELEYDDYKDLDVKDKVVLVMRYIPEEYNSENPFYDYAPLRYKAMNARERGAKAIIFFTPNSEQEEDDLTSVGLDYSYSDSGIQSLILKRDIAEELLLSAGKNLKEIESELSNKKNTSFEFPDLKAEVNTEVVEEEGRTVNVVGLIEGADSVLKDEYIVIGAHYDHIGLGKRNSRSYAKSGDSIHNGADDNASGVAGLVELAEFFSCKKKTLNRSLVFISFSAEELGLIGASYYVDNPKVSIDNTVAMINMDMIGRLDNNELTIFGVGSSPEWEGIINDSNSKHNFDISLNNSGFAPSDQSVFFAEGIPVLHFFTGLHDDYHTPSDDWEKINSKGQQKVLAIMSDVILDLDSRQNRIAFSNVKEPKKGSSKYNVYLGTIPDYSNQVEGVKLMGVREGSPAQKAGLLDDDTIIQFNGVSIKNIYDYVYALSDSKPGIPTSLVVLRNYKPISLIIVPEPRNDSEN